jgi:hypothetical protein
LTFGGVGIILMRIEGYKSYGYFGLDEVTRITDKKTGEVLIDVTMTVAPQSVAV